MMYMIETKYVVYYIPNITVFKKFITKVKTIN